MGEGDTTYFMIVMIFFILLGAILPFVQAAFNTDVTTHNADELTPEQSAEDFNTFNPLSAISILGSIVTVIFWSFNVSFYVNLLVIEPFRLLAYYLFVRMIRGN